MSTVKWFQKPTRIDSSANFSFSEIYVITNQSKYNHCITHHQEQKIQKPCHRKRFDHQIFRDGKIRKLTTAEHIIFETRQSQSSWWMALILQIMYTNPKNKRPRNFTKNVTESALKGHLKAALLQLT